MNDEGKPVPESETAVIVRNAEKLYQLLGNVGFTGKTFLELGESVQDKKGFRDLSKDVVKVMITIAKYYDPEPKPAVPLPAASETKEAKEETK